MPTLFLFPILRFFFRNVNVYLHVKIVMPREVGVKNEFFDSIASRIQQNILNKDL